jgi:protein gp37
MALASTLERYGNPVYKGLTKQVNGKAVWTGTVKMNSDSVLKKPLTVKVPSIFFVNSMSDFFHDEASDEMRLRVFDIARKTKHQYQILTKRPEAIEGFLSRTGIEIPKNVWIGATVEDRAAVFRIDLIRRVPAKIRFLSIEPLIGPLGPIDLSGIQWVISGGESGPGARFCDEAWVLAVDKACEKYKVPHFFKQWGAPKSNPLSLKAPAGVNLKKWLESVDPVGKGGSKLKGEYIKEMPGRFKVAEYDQGLLEVKG